MFTSIQMLRNSSAMQDRVSSVERNLKKINPKWKDHWLFPIAAVGLSNSADDIEWVLNNSGVQLDSKSQKRVRIQGNLMADGSAPPTVLAFNSLLKKFNDAKLGPVPTESQNKTAVVSAWLDGLNAVMKATHPHAEWKFGIILDEEAKKDDKAAAKNAGPIEQAAAPASETATTSAEPADAVSDPALRSPQLTAAVDAWRSLNGAEQQDFLQIVFNDCERT